MKKGRLYEIEALRGFAFLAVVLQHSIGHYYPLPETGLGDGVLMGILLLLSKFAVPVFLFITGIVLFYNYEGEVRWGSFFKKRFKGFWLPYMIWSLVYAMVFLLNPLSGESYATWGLWLLTGESSYHLWYVVMLAQIYLLFPFLRRGLYFLMKSPASALGSVLVLGVCYVGLLSQKDWIYQMAGAYRIPVITEWFTTYLDRNAIMFLFYFALGAAAGLHLDKWRELIVRYRTWVAAASIAMLGLMLFRIVEHFQLSPKLVIHYNDTLLLQPLMAVFLIVSILASYGCAYWFQAHARESQQKALAAIGKYSYQGYLAHALLLPVSTEVFDRIGGNITIRVLAAFILTSALSVGVAYILRQISLRASGKHTSVKAAD